MKPRNSMLQNGRFFFKDYFKGHSHTCDSTCMAFLVHGWYNSDPTLKHCIQAFRSIYKHTYWKDITVVWPQGPVCSFMGTINCVLNIYTQGQEGLFTKQSVFVYKTKCFCLQNKVFCLRNKVFLFMDTIAAFASTHGQVSLPSKKPFQFAVSSPSICRL